MWFKKSALQGDRIAQYFLAICYENGYEKDEKKVFEWYKQVDKYVDEDVIQWLIDRVMNQK